MEHFTHTITDDFADYNGNREMSLNGVTETTTTTVPPPGEGETSPTTKEIDIDALLNRAPIRMRHRRSRPLEEAPEFIQRLTAFAEVHAGEDVVFTCQWKAFPMPSVHWYRDDEDITDSTDPRHERESAVDGTETLKLRGATKKDEGAYKCRVENQEGVAATTGYLSVTGDIADKPLSTVHKKNKSEHSISSAPHLRTIVEQKSVEEREGEKAGAQDPSPIQTFIDNFRREKTWPMYGTGYDPNDDALSTGSSADLSSLSSEPSTPDLEDYSRVSFAVQQQQQQEGVSSPQNPSNLSVEPMIRAPSIEDIMGELQARDEEGEFAASEELKLKCQQEQSDSTDEDTCPTPTNFLDEPEFPDNTQAAAEQSTPEIVPLQTQSTPEIVPQQQQSTPEIVPPQAQSTPEIVPPQQQKSPEKKLVRSSNTIDSQDDPPLPPPVVPETQRASPVLKIETPESRRRMRRKSPSPQIELREIPQVMSRVFADQLELPWIYYFLFTSCFAAFAVATEMPVPYFVLLVAAISLISFRCLLPHNQ